MSKGSWHSLPWREKVRWNPTFFGWTFVKVCELNDRHTAVCFMLVINGDSTSLKRGADAMDAEDEVTKKGGY
jgi:hypothetical protein